MPPVLDRPPVLPVMQQHAEESAHLRHVRSVVVRAPHVQLHRLQRLDDRIAAHLDGLAVAGRHGSALCTQALARPGTGVVFAAAVLALESHDAPALDRLFALAATLPEAHRGLLSALGWVAASALKGTVRDLLAAREPMRRGLGLSACRLHRTDPGATLSTALQADDVSLRAAALRAAGELGRLDVLPAILDALDDPDAGVAFHAATAAVLLGNRDRALTALHRLAMADGPQRDPACTLFLLACGFPLGRDFVRALARSGPATPARQRRVVRACGPLGDLQFVPWLIELMDQDLLARVAGEAFSLITGADLALLDLERKPPALLPGGPSEHPEDDDVALDEDESLPWPDRARVQRWWAANGPTMPGDDHCFMGGPPAPARTLQVLRTGGQRQRFVAALHGVLQQPGSVLFPVCAPSWRQQRRLADAAPRE